VAKCEPELARKNAIWNVIETVSGERLYPYLEKLDAKAGDVLCEPGSTIDYAYFPLGAILSMVTVLRNGAFIETANIGAEGSFAICLALYGLASPKRCSAYTRCLVQSPGALLRVHLAVLAPEFAKSAELRDVAARHEAMLMARVQQSAACQAVHSVQERITRWILDMHDRVGRDEISFTHESLSQLHAMNRKSVTLALGALEKAGLITAGRGKITVCNRIGLEAAACECYAITKELQRSFEARSSLSLRRPGTHSSWPARETASKLSRQ